MLGPLRNLRLVALVGPWLLAGCAHDASGPGALASGSSPCPYGQAKDGTQSYALLCREPVANRVKVKHILVGWRGLAAAGHPPDPRADERSYPQAQELARSLLEKLRSGAAIEPLMEQYSEDPGSARSGQAYDASPGAGLVSEFKSLSLRLQVGEAGIVKSVFGLHIIQRVP